MTNVENYFFLAVLNQQFTVKLSTGEMPSGACTSSVIITIYGERDVSPTITFSSKRKAFVAGSIEVYPAIRLPSDIGPIYKIRVEITNTGTNPDWLCEKIEFENEATGEIIQFPCRRWLSSNHGDRSIIREIPALSESRAPVARRSSSN